MKNKFLAILLSAAMLAAIPAAAEETQNPVQTTLYVSAEGAENGDGSRTNPFPSIARAAEAVREINDNMTGDIVVEILPGRYYMTEEVKLREEDSGTNGYSIIYRGHGVDTVLTGGIPVTGFKEGKNGIWEAYAPQIEYCRYLSINDRMALQASAEYKSLKVADYDDPSTPEQYDGYYLKKTDFDFFENHKDMEIRTAYRWVDYRAKVKDIMEDPDNPEQLIVTFNQPYFNVHRGAALSWARDGGVPFSVHNAYELLDRPGEFYFNRQTKMMYYMPLEGEDMTTAIVEAGKTETFFDIKGLNVKSHVTGIKIENMKMVTTGAERFNEVGYLAGQAHVGYTNGEYGYWLHAVEIGWADHIDITDCIFSAMAGGAIMMGDSVADCKIVGNAIYDCGDSALAIGTTWTARDSGFGIDVRYPDGPAHVSQWDDRDSIEGKTLLDYMNGMNTGEYVMTPYPTRWTVIGEVEAARGELPWTSIDLGKPYNIEFVEFRFGAFDQNDLKPEYRQNFQVIAANEPDFSDGEVLYTQGGTVPPDILQAKGNGKKYRYVVVKKTKPEPLALGYFDVFSYDEPNEKTYEVVKRIDIRNNYFTRIGMDTRAACGVTIYYAQDLNFEHNEMTEVSYSGVNIGWGWERQWTAQNLKNVKVRYNDISRWNLECYDGGAVYTIGRMGFSVISHNYFHDGGMPYGAIYHDAGSCECDSFNNVVETAFSYHQYPWQPDSGYDIRAFDNYATVTRYGDWSGDTTLAISPPEYRSYSEPPIYYPRGSMPEEAHDIVENAGLEPEYEHIKDYVPENEANFGWGMDSYTGATYSFYETQRDFINLKFVEEAEKLMANVDFGYLPGQYDPDYQLILNGIITEHTQWQTNDILDEQSILLRKIQTILRSAPEYKNTLPLDELTAFCDEFIKNIQIGEGVDKYPQNAVNEFKANIAAIKSSDSSDYKKVYDIEKELCVLYKTARHSDILAAKTDEGRFAEVDMENRVITVPVRTAEAAKAVKLETLISDNVRIYPDIKETIDLSEAKEFSLYYTDIEDPVIWTVQAEVSPETEKWVNADYVTTMKGKLDGEYIKASYSPYMRGDKVSEKYVEYDLRITPYTERTGFSIIFGAKTPELYRYGKTDVYSHYEFTVQDGKAYVYRFKDGIKTALSEEKVEIADYDALQNIKITYENSVIKVTLNGKTVASCLTDDIEEIGYTGLMAEKGTIYLP